MDTAAAVSEAEALEKLKELIDDAHYPRIRLSKDFKAHLVGSATIFL